MQTTSKLAGTVAFTAVTGGLVLLLRRGAVDYHTRSGERLTLPALFAAERELVSLVEGMLE